MQIVRDLGGYTLGRSDLVRRAMSKKKIAVMEKERQNFVYGNEAENVKGCVNNGIDEKVANIIYDEMIDFAKYAFNKSHAAAYAVVSYETAYLKHYYPVEFMAALMTSVIDNASKVSEYIQVCRQMGIKILPPDINKGVSEFSVSNGSIMYGLSAIKSVGKNVIEELVKEREEHGPYTSLKDFIYRLSSKEANRRTLESFIKAGALDGLPGNRRQKVLASAEILDRKNREKKIDIAGQMSLFDMMGAGEREEYEPSLPNVSEFEREEMLNFEKEMLGVYLSGHPMDEYEKKWRENITAVTSDFVIDEETGASKVHDGESVIVGGMITGRTIKTTKSNQMMAFMTVEDMIGSLEIIVFPRDYEKFRSIIMSDAKVFVRGRVSAGDETQAKLICEDIIPFDSVPKDLWLQFANKETYFKAENELLELIKNNPGEDKVIIYLRAEKQKKELPVSQRVEVNGELLRILKSKYSEEDVKVVEKPIEKTKKMKYNLK